MIETILELSSKADNLIDISHLYDMRFEADFLAQKIAREINHRQFGFTVFHNSGNGAHRNLYIKGYARIRVNFLKAGIPEIFIANLRNKNLTIYKIGLNMPVRK